MAKPIVVEPSQAWDGNDGPWSTFAIRVGTPAQLFRVLASTTAPETWVVGKDGCISTDPPGCANDRGNLYNNSTSSTWKFQGNYALGIELNLPYTENFDNGGYGYDTLGVGYPGSGGPTMDQQVVAAIDTKDFYLGNLGLTPRPVNFTWDDPTQSFLSTLKDQKVIPSLSFGYNAGAQYRLKKAVASLTLGGYDSSRFTPNNISFNFASDISRDLVVGLQSIKFSDSETQNEELLIGGGILSFIDSTVPHIWLPLDACRAFEKAFGITYDNKTDLYLVNDSLHDTLKQQDASLSFILGNQIDGGDAVNITFPYAAFDLTVGSPIVNTSQSYFPLRRAANDSQYTLGRTFLQESFLTVDYERSTFHVSQAIWTSNASQNITTILSVDDSTPTLSPSKPDPSHKLSTGATIGIIVAAVCFCLLLIGAAIGWFLWRRGKRRKSEKISENNIGEKSEIEDTSPQKPNELHSDANTPGEVEGDGTFYGNNNKHGLEMEGSPGRDSSRAEAPGTHGGVEIEGSRGGIEMEGSRVPEMDGGQGEVFELPAGDYLMAGTGRERRGRRSPGTSRSQATSYNPAEARSPTSPTSP
ncbi:MAG: hypothetical protein HETSPECPRED_009407 [Heterodermia speciosa]|uniref:Peptidase A1 domain-containing protein n=1 Tax=Heterodermia speciosa TaxID=116794 RepID=A0A8H3G1H9_9LECA|nr:MAG: hypothetical protein HETSPECPRED_009407 [Heterodermia speciosa]